MVAACAANCVFLQPRALHDQRHECLGGNEKSLQSEPCRLWEFRASFFFEGYRNRYRPMARLSLRAFDEEALRERISTLCDQLMRSRSGVTSAQDRVHGLEGALHAVVDKAGKAASRLAMRDAGQAGSIACHALPGGKPIRTRQGLELPAEAPGTCRLQPPAEHGGRHDLGRIHAPSGRLRGKLPVHFRQRPQASGTAHPLRCAAPVGLPRSSIMFRAQPQERSTDVGAAPTGRDQDIGRCMGRALADTKAQIGSVGGGAVRLFECRKIAGGMAILVVMVRGTETFQGLSNSVAAALPYRTRVH